MEDHKFLVHKRGDHVGVATENIEKGERIAGYYMDDNGRVQVVSNGEVPLGHKIAVQELDSGGEVIEYGTRIGVAPQGFKLGDYVHTHNIKSARW